MPEQIRNLNGYSYLTGMVKEKLPDKLPFELPKKFPFDLSFKLPFELPGPGNLLGSGRLPDKKKITEDLAAYKGDNGSSIKFDSLEIRKSAAAAKGKTDTVYVTTITNGEMGAVSSDYRLVYKRRIIGGWKLFEVKPYKAADETKSVAGADLSAAAGQTADSQAEDAAGNPAADSQASGSPNVVSRGMDDQSIINDQGIFHDISQDWKHSNVKVLEHNTDLKTGTDTVLVYMELENSYVNMKGTKEIIYQYNAQTKNWEAVSVSKLTCQSIIPAGQ